MTATERRCAWCDGPIPDSSRDDAETCSKACRQARHRFRVAGAPGLPARGRNMRFAYADPPYPRLARKYYKDEEVCAEVDHRELVDRLVAEYPDGWALSTSSAALIKIAKLCPDDGRIAVWVKGSRAGVSFRARSAYEPVIIWRGRPRRRERDERLDDVLLWGGRQHSHPGALVGMKPPAFSEWLFKQIGACAGDHLDDLFPGSGAVGRAWQLYVGGSVAPDPRDASSVDARRGSRSELPSRMEEAAAAAPDRISPQQRIRWSG